MKTTKWIIQIKYTGDNEFEDSESFDSEEEAWKYYYEMQHPEGRWEARIVERSIEESILTPHF